MHLVDRFSVGDDLDGSMRVAEAIMSDYGIVQFSTENRRLRACDTARSARGICRLAALPLAKCDRARTIVVTHHAPECPVRSALSRGQST